MVLYMAYKGRKEKSNGSSTIPIAKTGTAEKAVVVEMHKDSQLSQPGDEGKLAIQVRNEQDKVDSHEVTSEKEKEHNLDV